MDYSKYYTPPTIANLLINELDVSTPQKAVDICCGSCNLLNAVKNRWKSVELIGVDVEDHPMPGVNFINDDGRKYATDHLHEFDLVVANPPFDFLQAKNEFPELYQGLFKNLYCSRLEVEMLLANLLMLKDGGILLVILPSSIVEAGSYQKLRILLSKYFYIKSIIKLADDTFGSAKIRSYALIIQNCINKRDATRLGYTEYNVDGPTVIYGNSVVREKMEKGLWTEFDENKTDLKLFDFRRGTISSASFQNSGKTILHTARSGAVWRPSIRFIPETLEATVFAENGDILVSRVGKSAGQWCVYYGDRVPISDCLYRLKDPNGDILNKITGKYYNRELKGVATRYITMSDFAKWIDTC